MLGDRLDLQIERHKDETKLCFATTDHRIPVSQACSKPFADSLISRSLAEPDRKIQTRDGSNEAAAAMEGRHVHAVYDVIASHFSATRFAVWPKVGVTSCPCSMTIFLDPELI